MQHITIKKDIDDNLLRTLLKCPHYNLNYGFLYIDPRVSKLIGIIPEFNTFAEIWQDLQLIDNSLWHLTKLENPEERPTYVIKGNGFIYKY